jgi:putative pyruvate formate lyase activating enzyme
LVDLLAECNVCPRHCRSRRLDDKKAVCRTGRYAEVASWCLHRGEEPCLSAGNGSGTVFFAHCNLSCLFCQNTQISQGWEDGAAVKSPRELAEIYLDLQRQGADNLNWVSPSHVVPQAVEALLLAADRGLHLPLVYNSNGYDDQDTLRLLDGIVDIYLPDLKYASEDHADELSRAVGYVTNSQAALREMWRQVGPLRLNEDGLAQRGLLVRHLVLPGGLSDTPEVLRFLAGSLGQQVAVSLMAQYYPASDAADHPVLSRTLTRAEWDEALRALDTSGLEEGYVQDLTAPDHYRPDFDKDGHPFEG